ncbi:MAG: hypothetical protein HZB76_00730 [Chlamydiae bacterium]|nr:hypothetical protein [Chlamydiota bacterium]
MLDPFKQTPNGPGNGKTDTGIALGIAGYVLAQWVMPISVVILVTTTKVTLLSLALFGGGPVALGFLLIAIALGFIFWGDHLNQGFKRNISLLPKNTTDAKKVKSTDRTTNTAEQALNWRNSELYSNKALSRSASKLKLP